ncbi:transcription factor TFIIIC subunit tfc4 [Nowakowskiella sp. JEL0407]|nr:transcription factor TFIIIC subunit tfc4 [Nowakowskiella sp. JEL0407]
MNYALPSAPDASDDEEEYDDVPEFVGKAMREAAKGIGEGFSANEFQSSIWEVDEDAMRELRDEFGYDEFGEVGDGERKKRKKTGSVRRDMSAEVREIYGKANTAYIMKDYASAMEYLHQVIRKAPALSVVWMLLATIQDEMGNSTQAFQSLFVAAHIDRKNNDLWKKLALISMKLGQKRQMLYCMEKAHKSDRKNPHILWEIATIYHQHNMYQKAIVCYERILKLIPHYVPAIREMAKIFVLLNNYDEIIPYFENALDADLNEPLEEPLQRLGYLEKEVDEDEEIIDESDGVPRRIGWEELNMLCELYLDTGKKEKVVQYIHLVAPWLMRGQKLQPYAGNIDPCYGDDSEFGKGDDLPIELRVKLGIARLRLGMKQLADIQFDLLFERPIEEEFDLNLDIADALIDCKFYEDALSIFDKLSRINETDIPSVWTKRAFCYQQLSDWEAAAQLYERVLQDQSDDNVRLSLAQVYRELGELDRAYQLAEQVGYSTMQADPNDLILRHQPGAIIEPFELEEEGEAPKSAPTKRQQRRFDEAVKKAEEAQRKKENIAAFEKSKIIFQKNPEMEDKLARMEYIRTVRPVIARFQNARIFYPEKVKPFTGYGPKRNAKESDKPAEPAEVPDNFQGISFEQWYELFIDFAKVLCFDNQESEAQTVLKSALEANIFYSNMQKSTALRMHMIAAAIQCENFDGITDILRLMSSREPCNEIYRLYNAVFGGLNAESIMSYASSTNVKYFKRMTQISETGVRSKSTQKATSSSAATSTNAYPIPVESNVLYTTMGGIWGAGRGYISAMNSYLKAYRHSPDEPLINLAIGISFLHRAMQRKTENRHLQILQGFTFLFRYRELRLYSFESSYNIARAFHQIGLAHLAIPYYEEVLGLNVTEGRRKMAERGLPEETESLAKEAAYNLSLLYMSVGSGLFAEKVLRDFCTI